MGLICAIVVSSRCPVARHDGEKLGWIVLDLGAAKANAKRSDYLEGKPRDPRTTEC